MSHDDLVLAVGQQEERLGSTDPIRRNTLAAGDTVRGALAYGLWTAAYVQDPDEPVDITQILLASAALATMKCYVGSFIDFLKLLERLRGTSIWNALWAPRSDQGAEPSVERKGPSTAEGPDPMPFG